MPPQQGQTLLDLFGQVNDLGAHAGSNHERSLMAGWL
jgi:hypothetical protein